MSLTHNSNLVQALFIVASEVQIVKFVLLKKKYIKILKSIYNTIILEKIITSAGTEGKIIQTSLQTSNNLYTYTDPSTNVTIIL